jgi:hypothetical protein
MNSTQQFASVVVDVVFDEAMENVVAETQVAKVMAVAEELTKQKAYREDGRFNGKIVEITEDLFAQKVGRDSSNIVWHSSTLLTGEMTRVGDIVDITYKHGIGTLKHHDLKINDVGGFER